MDEQALNRKLNHRLAEWAGVQPEKIFEHPGYYLSYPNFTESLDACFKWLVPELYKQGYEYLLQGYTYHGAILRKQAIHYVSNGEKTPALALCLAISKLIEEGVSENEYV